MLCKNLLHSKPLAVVCSRFAATNALSASSMFPASHDGITIHMPSITRGRELQPRVKSYKEIPGPKGLPVIGTALQYAVGWNGLALDKMFEAYQMRYAKYGPIFKENFGPISMVVISDFNEYSKIIRADGKFPRRIPLEPLLEYRLRNNLDCGMVNGDGEVWYKYRSAINQKMLRPTEVAHFVDKMDDVALECVDVISRSTNQDGVVPDMLNLLFKWSLESVNAYLLDKKLGTLSMEPSDSAQNMAKNVVGIFKCMQKLMFNLPFYKYVRTATWKQFEMHCSDAISEGMNIIHQRLDELNSSGPLDFSEKQSLVSYMLAKGTMSNYQIAIQIVELLIGSVETAANTLLWSLYLLSKDPARQQKLHNEIASIVGDGNETLTPEKLNQLKYAKACIKETLRMYPVSFATSRLVSEDVEVCGYNIPSGTHVQANLLGMNYNSRVFPKPFTFSPERWLGRKTEEMASASLVWGHGARMCIGRRIAEQEMLIALTRIIQNFNVSFPGEEAPEPVLHTVITSQGKVSLQFKDRATPK